MNMHNVPAKLRRLSDIVEEYDQKRANMQQAISDFSAAITALNTNATVGGTYVGIVTDARAPGDRKLEHLLRQSAWRHVYQGLNLDRIASASDRKRFEMSFEDPPEFTLENIAATFGQYVENPRFHILKGLAECFSDLDPAFKSHQKVKIGVEGLPKRIIIRSVCSEWGSAYGWGFDRLRDTIKALATFDGEEWNDRLIHDAVTEASKHGEADVYDGLRLQVYKNRNGHLIFGKERLRSINLALAEFYGDVLPDTPDETPDPERDLFRSREVSKDLQFYPTPDKVADDVVCDALNMTRTNYPEGGFRVLEPSCGDGRILDALRRWWERQRHPVKAMSIEVQDRLAEKARAKGYTVHVANFLQVPPPEEHLKYDAVVMNPPFYGEHWKKHLVHARKFLKQGGRGICILPAAALVDGHLEAMGFIPKGNAYNWRDRWTDLPTASFRESGTNVATGYLTFFAERSE